MQISLTMDHEDFAQLCEDSGNLSSLDPEVAAERLNLVGVKAITPPSLHWSAIYWVGHSWANVMLARAFLQGLGEEFEIANDEAEHPNGQSLGLVILTNYECPADRVFSG